MASKKRSFKGKGYYVTYKSTHKEHTNRIRSIQKHINENPADEKAVAALARVKSEGPSHKRHTPRTREWRSVHYDGHMIKHFSVSGDNNPKTQNIKVFLGSRGEAKLFAQQCSRIRKMNNRLETDRNYRELLSRQTSALTPYAP